jgi:lipoprotein-anchoring transpeptidase ErfK/SrfK
MRNVTLTKTFVVWASLPVASIVAIAISLSQQVAAPSVAAADIVYTSIESDSKAQPESEESNRPNVAFKPPSFYPFRVSVLNWSTLKNKFGEDAALTILKLNRVDRGNLANVKSLIVSDNLTDPNAVSPFPLELGIVRDLPKLIVVSRKVQAFGAYESGKLVRWGPTSTGKRSTQTPTGLYHANWKSKKTRSTVDSSWILPWVFNLDNFEGIAFHEYELPGYPASHGCVRLLQEDARWLYSWADMWILSVKDRSLLAHGTPVVIFGDYDWKRGAPWKQLNVDPNAAAITETEVEDALNGYMVVIQARSQARDLLLYELDRLPIIGF